MVIFKDSPVLRGEVCFSLQFKKNTVFPYFRRGNSLKNKVIRLFPQAELRPKIRITGIIGNNQPD